MMNLTFIQTWNLVCFELFSHVCSPITWKKNSDLHSFPSHSLSPTEFLFLSMNDSCLLEYPELETLGEGRGSSERHQCWTRYKKCWRKLCRWSGKMWLPNSTQSDLMPAWKYISQWLNVNMRPSSHLRLCNEQVREGGSMKKKRKRQRECRIA